MSSGDGYNMKGLGGLLTMYGGAADTIESQYKMHKQNFLILQKQFNETKKGKRNEIRKQMINTKNLIIQTKKKMDTLLKSIDSLAKDIHINTRHTRHTKQKGGSENDIKPKTDTNVSETNETEEDELIEDHTKFKIKKYKDMYEWGFDLTDFNDKETRGNAKFQELLDDFNLTLKQDNRLGVPFEWSNSDKSIILITSNNPITGENFIRGRMIKSGYLDNVGVSCKSPRVLQHFINEFRKKASSIKGESNERKYI